VVTGTCDYTNYRIDKTVQMLEMHGPQNGMRIRKKELCESPVFVREQIRGMLQRLQRFRVQIQWGH
jgi:hypothetical protein